jgi:hypothetical protein
VNDQGRNETACPMNGVVSGRFRVVYAVVVPRDLAARGRRAPSVDMDVYSGMVRSAGGGHVAPCPLETRGAPFNRCRIRPLERCSIAPASPTFAPRLVARARQPDLVFKPDLVCIVRVRDPSCYLCRRPSGEPSGSRFDMRMHRLAQTDSRELAAIPLACAGLAVVRSICLAVFGRPRGTGSRLCAAAGRR